MWEDAPPVSNPHPVFPSVATLDAASPHYGDQSRLFVECKTKPVWMDEADIRKHLEGDYRPGEPRPAPKAPGTLDTDDTWPAPCAECIAK